MKGLACVRPIHAVSSHLASLRHPMFRSPEERSFTVSQFWTCRLPFLAQRLSAATVPDPSQVPESHRPLCRETHPGIARAGTPCPRQRGWMSPSSTPSPFSQVLNRLGSSARARLALPVWPLCKAGLAQGRHNPPTRRAFQAVLQVSCSRALQ